MKNISVEHLQEMIEKCVSESYTKGLIVTDTARRAKDICDSFKENLDAMPEIESVTSRCTTHEVRFKNGSCITIKHASDSLRGHRAHLVLYDDLIDEATKSVLQSYELSSLAREYITARNRLCRVDCTSSNNRKFVSYQTLSEMSDRIKKNIDTNIKLSGIWNMNEDTEFSSTPRKPKKTMEPEDESSPALDDFLNSFTVQSDNQN